MECQGGGVFISPLLGLCFGLGSVGILAGLISPAFIDESKNEPIDIAVPLCVAYLSFFVGVKYILPVFFVNTLWVYLAF
jgi:hypothetical protein